MKSKIIVTAKAQSIVFLLSGKKKNRKRKLKDQDNFVNISKATNEGTSQKESTNVPPPKRRRRRRKSEGICNEEVKEINEEVKEIIPKEEKLDGKCVGYLLTSNSQIK